MKTCEMTSLDLLSTADLISELDKRADRVIIIMETSTLDKPGLNFMIHNNAGFKTREHMIFSLMSHVKHLTDECLEDQNDS